MESRDKLSKIQNQSATRGPFNIGSSRATNTTSSQDKGRVKDSFNDKGARNHSHWQRAAANS